MSDCMTADCGKCLACLEYIADCNYRACERLERERDAYEHLRDQVQELSGKLVAEVNAKLEAEREIDELRAALEDTNAENLALKWSITRRWLHQTRSHDEVYGWWKAAKRALAKVTRERERLGNAANNYSAAAFYWEDRSEAATKAWRAAINALKLAKQRHALEMLNETLRDVDLPE